jgi:NADH-quinone oxidoreductase subunit L
MGAIMSIIIAFSGIFLAYSMYVKKSLNPKWWTDTFAGYTNTLKGKYFFDDFYIETVIKKMLLPMNSFLAWVDMGIYDKYAVDGWEAVNRWLYKASRWFDDYVIDAGMVDGTGASVRLMNVVMRTIQSGKVQLYFVVLIVVLASYVWSLSF